ncbi:MAG: cupredoxin domain-containing protein, partial [Chloroflexi bacterium]|nr:cupredoxin domain-containing protein [Chloroflexota bacterium]
MIKRLFLLAALASMVLAACGAQTSSAAPMQRTIYMTAVEPKGTTSASSEPFPSVAMPEGGGYILKATDKDGNWSISTYRWDPNQIIVNQGDVVTLEIMGINGKEHPFSIETYGTSGVVKRGQWTRVTFTADKAGVFKIHCGVHLPSMQAELIVLPKN